MMAMKRMSTLASGSRLSPEAQQLGEHLAQYKEESEKESIDEVSAAFRSPLFGMHIDNLTFFSLSRRAATSRIMAASSLLGAHLRSPHTRRLRHSKLQLHKCPSTRPRPKFVPSVCSKHATGLSRNRHRASAVLLLRTQSQFHSHSHLYIFLPRIRLEWCWYRAPWSLVLSD